MTLGKKIVSYILSLILAILLISIILIGCVRSNVLNKNNMKKAFQKTDYYYNLYGIIKENTENDIMSSGFEISVLDNVFTEDKIKQDVNNVIEGIYDNKKTEISTEEMKKQLDENVKKQLENTNYQVTEENKKKIEEFENSVIKIYTDNIIYSEDIINQISEKMHKINKIAIIIMIISCILSIILALVIFMLNKSSLGISMFVTGTFFIFLNLYSGTAIVINNILMFNWAISNTFAFIANKTINSMYIIGMIFAFIGLAEIIGIGIWNAKRFVKFSFGKCFKNAF